MTKQEILASPTVAYYIMPPEHLEIKGIEYGIDDYLICVSASWYAGNPHLYRLKIQTDCAENSYVCLHGHEIKLGNCITAAEFNARIFRKKRKKDGSGSNLR